MTSPDLHRLDLHPGPPSTPARFVVLSLVVVVVVRVLSSTLVTYSSLRPPLHPLVNPVPDPSGTRRVTVWWRKEDLCGPPCGLGDTPVRLDRGPGGGLTLVEKVVSVVPNDLKGGASRRPHFLP